MMMMVGGLKSRALGTPDETPGPSAGVEKHRLVLGFTTDKNKSGQ